MFQPSKKTIEMLEDIERRIDPDTEETFVAQWRDFNYDRFTGDLFLPYRKQLSAPSIEMPNVHVNDTIKDYDLMLQGQLCAVSNALNTNHLTLGLWAGYGTGILSSVLGAEIFIPPRELNTPPTTRVLGSTDAIRAMVDRGMPDLDAGFGKQLFECGSIFAEVFSKYPNISKYVSVFHPDLQGPLDICELLWGGDMFYAMYDEPELVHAALSLITETFTAMMHRWRKIFPFTADMNTYRFYHHRGGITLRCDSATNLSPSLYREYAIPYDSLLFERFGGGAMHFCGKGDHYIEALSETPGLYAINMSQPDMNDMEIIYRNTVDKGIKILGLGRLEALRANEQREKGLNHCVSSFRN